MFIPLRPSITLAVLLLLMHGLSLVGMLYIPMAWPLKALFGIVLMGSLVYYLRRYAWLRSDRSIIEAEIKPDCICALRTLRGEWHRGKLLPSTFIAPYLVILNLALEDGPGRLAVVIFPDAIDAERFRELRVLLKWKCGKLITRV